MAWFSCPSFMSTKQMLRGRTEPTGVGAFICVVGSFVVTLRTWIVEYFKRRTVHIFVQIYSVLSKLKGHRSTEHRDTVCAQVCPNVVFYSSAIRAYSCVSK